MDGEIPPMGRGYRVEVLRQQEQANPGTRTTWNDTGGERRRC